MKASLLQLLGALVIVAGPLFLIWHAVRGLRDIRAMLRSKPHTDASIARIVALNASLRTQIGDLQRECSRLDARLVALERWAQRVSKKA